MATTTLHTAKSASLIWPASASGSDRRNPLEVVWNYVSILVAAASLAWNYVSILVAAAVLPCMIQWGQFVDQLVLAYQSRAYSVLAPLSSWFPVGTSSIAMDYLVMGGLVSLTFLQAAWSWDTRLTVRLLLLPVLAIVVAPMWPLFLMLTLTWIVQGEEDTQLLEQLRQSAVAVWQWLGSIALVIVLVVLVNFVLG